MERKREVKKMLNKMKGWSITHTYQFEIISMLNMKKKNSCLDLNIYQVGIVRKLLVDSLLYSFENQLFLWKQFQLFKCV